MLYLSETLNLVLQCGAFLFITTPAYTTRVRIGPLPTTDACLSYLALPGHARCWMEDDVLGIYRIFMPPIDS